MGPKHMPCMHETPDRSCARGSELVGYINDTFLLSVGIDRRVGGKGKVRFCRKVGFGRAHGRQSVRRFIPAAMQLELEFQLCNYSYPSWIEVPVINKKTGRELIPRSIDGILCMVMVTVFAILNCQGIQSVSQLRGDKWHEVFDD